MFFLLVGTGFDFSEGSDPDEVPVETLFLTAGQREKRFICIVNCSGSGFMMNIRFQFF